MKTCENHPRNTAHALDNDMASLPRCWRTKGWPKCWRCEVPWFGEKEGVLGRSKT